MGARENELQIHKMDRNEIFKWFFTRFFTIPVKFEIPFFLRWLPLEIVSKGVITDNYM